MFAPQNLRTPPSTTRFHSPLYPPLNNLTPLKILFPCKMNAPHPLPFLFQLRTLSSPTFYQQFLSTINFTISSLPSTLFLASSLSFLHLSRFLSHFFFLISFFPLLRFFLSFHHHVKGASLPSPHFLLSFSNLSTPSKNFSRRLHISCLLFSMLVFLCPSFISLSPCLAPPKRRSEYMHVLKAVLLFSFLSSVFSSLFFLFFFFSVVVFVFVLRYRKSAENIHTPKSASTLSLSSVISTWLL